MADGKGLAAPGDRGEIVTSERWKEVETVFEQALERPAEERAGFVQKSCDGDEELRREVESLLESHSAAGDFIDERSRFFSGEDFKDGDEAIATGQLIGAYRIIREIGRGGMGAVYLAERADQQYQKQVAIKLIKRGMDTDSVLRHFRNERQILASFDHPNVARLFDAGTTENGLPYFVMEYIEGLPIDQYCGTRQLSLVDRLKLFREVCAAVSYAHRHTVIHRDIKISNILVTGEGTPKLLDFGIAKILQPGIASEPLLTITGIRPMTPEYASPEQVRGEPVTTASDVYSLGIVLYELLTGRSPYRFASRSPLDVARAITDTEPSKPSTMIAETKNAKLGPHRAGVEDLADSRFTSHDSRALRGDLDNIVLMALRKEPERRYQSVEQLSEDIRRHLEARPVAARKDTIGYRAGKFVRRNKVATAAAVLVFLSLLGGVIATTWQAHQARIARARAERRFNDVRQLAHSVLFDYHDAIKNLPGATRARERLVKDALTYLDSLAREAGGDPGLQRELAAAYERVGDVRGEVFAASMGDRVGALDSYKKALTIREALVAATPHDAQNRHDLATSYSKIGNQLIETSEAGHGLEYLRKSFDIYSELASEKPTDAAGQRDVAEVLTLIGLAEEDRGDVAGALESHRQAHAIYERLFTADPNDRAIRRSLSVCHENIGRASFLNNDSKGALESNGKALVLREALLTEDPTNADYRRILGISYQNKGDYLAWGKNTQEALDSFRKKFALDEQSVAADPANAQSRGDLAYSCDRIGDLLSALGDYSQALPYFERSLQIYEKNAALDPENQSVALAAIQTRAKLGKTHAKLGNIELARKECDRTAKLLQATIDDPGNVGPRRSRVLAYGDLGETHAVLAANKGASRQLKMEHWRAARDMYQHSLAIMEEFREHGILDAEELPEIEATKHKIAECDASLQNVP